MPVIDEAARIAGEIAELRHAIHPNRTGHPELAEKEARALARTLARARPCGVRGPASYGGPGPGGSMAW